MNYDDLKISARKIVMSDETKEELIKNCEKITEVKNMGKKKTIVKRAVVIAIVSVCLCCTAAGAAYHGFFKDIIRYDGAVVGTKYEQATNEIKVSVTTDREEITVVAEAVDPLAIPYVTFDNMKLNDYKIIDTNGKTVIDNLPVKGSDYTDGKLKTIISFQNFNNGDYKLIISSFVGESKGDQPLVIGGEWEVAFTF